jgi:hypothetical protein
MKDAISAINEFYEDVKPKLDIVYDWKIPAFPGFSDHGTSSYEANIKLKSFLNQQWLQANKEEKTRLAKFVVSDWGGVRANKDETLSLYTSNADMPHPETPLYGVASYSKIFSIAAPARYAIYDARVAACLNATQFLAGVKNGLAFNYVAGRNNVVGHSGKKQGFVYNEYFKVESLQASGWSKVARNDTYKAYLTLLNACAKRLGNTPLYALEMSLFAFAEQQCSKAVKHRH